MFDLSFLELVVIGVVALIVVGPERLPTVARTAGRLVGRFQRFMNTMAEDLNKELEIEELRKMHQQAKLELDRVNQKAIEESNKAQQALADAERQFNTVGQEVAQEVQQVTNEVAGQANRAVADIQHTAATTSSDASTPPERS